MKIRFNFGPAAGQTRHIEWNWMVQLLVDAGVIEKCEQLVDPPKPGVPPARTERWDVSKSVFGKVCILLVTRLGESVPFTGDPDHAAATFATVGAKVPPEIVERYRAVLAADNPAAREAAAERAEQERNRLDDAMKANRQANTYAGSGQ